MSKHKHAAWHGLGVIAVSMAIGLAACVAHADTYIYRGVNASNSGRAQLNPGTFRFNPNLSTFDQPSTTSACNYRFTVRDIAHEPPQPNDQGTVQGLAGYVADFNNVPPGHWDIVAPASDPNPAQTVATYAQANRQNVVNGASSNCN